MVKIKVGVTKAVLILITAVHTIIMCVQLRYAGVKTS